MVAVVENAVMPFRDLKFHPVQPQTSIAASFNFFKKRIKDKEYGWMWQYYKILSTSIDGVVPVLTFEEYPLFDGTIKDMYDNLLKVGIRISTIDEFWLNDESCHYITETEYIIAANLYMKRLKIIN